MIGRKHGLCHGCCHEAAEPCRRCNQHFPSGEKACMDCIRNPDRCKGLKPKDNYTTMEKLRMWMKIDEENRLRLIPEKVKFD